MVASFKYDMTDEEAIALGKRAIYHATHRDAMSGGINNRTLPPTQPHAHLLLCTPVYGCLRPTPHPSSFPLPLALLCTRCPPAIPPFD